MDAQAFGTLAGHTYLWSFLRDGATISTNAYNTFMFNIV